MAAAGIPPAVAVPSPSVCVRGAWSHPRELDNRSLCLVLEAIHIRDSRTRLHPPQLTSARGAVARREDSGFGVVQVLSTAAAEFRCSSDSSGLKNILLSK